MTYYTQKGKLRKFSEDELLEIQSRSPMEIKVFEGICSNTIFEFDGSGNVLREFPLPYPIPTVKILSSVLITEGEHGEWFETDTDYNRDFFVCKPLFLQTEHKTKNSQYISAHIYMPLYCCGDTHECLEWSIDAPQLNECEVTFAAIQEHSEKYWTDEIKDRFEELMDDMMYKTE